MFTSQPIGFVSSPYKDASDIPNGLGAKHEADGVLKILPEFEPGLTDIEGPGAPGLAVFETWDSGAPVKVADT